MLSHYLKIAFRNMWKYKSQTLISLIGLAVGFTCFALSMLWIRYEMSFDSFHKNAKRMYVVYKAHSTSPSGYSKRTPYPLAVYLKETFPEVKDAITVTPPTYAGNNGKINDMEFQSIHADSSLFRMFDVKILEGNRDFLIPRARKIAITQDKALQLFGNENPIGKTVSISVGEYTICAIVSGISKRSNYAFDFILPFFALELAPAGDNWMFDYGENTIIELFPRTNVEAFEKKLAEHDLGEDKNIFVKNMIIRPLTKLRYTDPDIVREVKFQHIVIFAISGLLVILCSLFNYFALFVNRFRIRKKELALRVTCGATKESLLVMLTVEFVLTLILSVALGFVFAQWLHQPFQKLSEIKMDLFTIYREIFIYAGCVILMSLLVFWILLFIFRHSNLNLSINRSNKNLSRKISVITQLVISMGFVFSSIIILKQIYFLHHTSELGFSFQNRGSILIMDVNISQETSGVLANHLKQVPEITEVVELRSTMANLLPPPRFGNDQLFSIWDDKPASADIAPLLNMYVSQAYTTFYDFQLIDGKMLTDADPDSLVLLNENAAKAFGWHEPVGKSFDRYKVKGVIKNIHNYAPTVPSKPTFYSNIPSMMPSKRSGIMVMFQYREGMWKNCKGKIEQVMIKEYPEISYRIYNNEEEYDKLLKSENALLKLLSFLSMICILICVFGFVSLVSLTLEERRKSIAIRKINGATSGNILAIFAKEYSLLLLIGSAIALTAGFFIMQRWLEQYVKQTGIPVWIYLSILFVMALIIVLCVGWQVWRASVENPSEVVKKEN